MNKHFSVLRLAIGLLLTVQFVTACGGDNDNDSNGSNKSYRLIYKSENNNSPYLDWNTSKKTFFLRLEFDEGIPKGSEWYLNCDESWVKLSSRQGKVNASYESITITIEDNTDYRDRVAHINLDVRNGIPSSNQYTTVTIHQLGYESHLNRGREMSLITNRSIATNSTLSINSIKVYQVMDVDWGDGSKNILTRNDYYSTSNLSISHTYNSNGTFTIKLRFAPDNDRTSFGFSLDKGHGVEAMKYYDKASVTTYIDNKKKVLVSYSDENGFNINQY